MIRRAIAVVAFLLLTVAGQAGAQETTTTSAPVDPTTTTATTIETTTTTALATTTTRAPIETTTSVSVLPMPSIIPDPATTTTAAAVVFYANCDAAALAGATNIASNQPGYRAELDRDGDGVACETGDVSDLTGDDIVVIADEAGLPVTGSPTSLLAVFGAACAALGAAWWLAMKKPRRTVR